MVSALLSLVVLLNPSPSLAASVADLCGEDAGHAICAGPSVTTPSGQISKKIKQAAAAEVNRYLGMHGTPAYFEQLVLHTLSTTKLTYRGGPEAPKKIMKSGLLYLACSDYLAKAYFAGLSSEHTCFAGVENKAHPELLDSLIEKLDDKRPAKIDQIVENSQKLVVEVINRTAFSDMLKKDLADQIDKDAELQTPLDYVNQLLDNAYSSRVNFVDSDSIAMVKECGFNLDSVEAAEVPFGGLMICPSVWVDAMQTPNVGEEAYLISTFTHEIGHVIEGRLRFYSTQDPVYAPAVGTRVVYDSTLSCMNEQYGVTGKLKVNLPEFDLPKEQAEQTKFLNAMDFVPKEKVAEAFYHEYSADVISSQAMALYLDSLPAQADRANIVTRNFYSLCYEEEKDNVEDEDLSSPKFADATLHPAPEFRIRESYFGNEDFRRAVGCAPRGPSTYCPLLKSPSSL